jgi:hypothetical protein
MENTTVKYTDEEIANIMADIQTNQEIECLESVRQFRYNTRNEEPTQKVVQEMCFIQEENEMIFVESFWNKVLAAKAIDCVQSPEEYGALGQKVIVDWLKLFSLVCPTQMHLA